MYESTYTSPITPVTPPAPWVGGKRSLSARIIEQLQMIDHKVYAEPFLGMGGVFLRRPFRSQVEVVNDLNRDVANLFRILQWHYEALMDELKWKLTTKDDFDRLLAANPDTLTDIQRAERFLYLQRLSFGGKVVTRSFGRSRGISARFDVSKLGSILQEVHERLTSVTIDCLTWQRFIAQYDGIDTLFYLDPPYFMTEHYYGRGLFQRAEFEELAQVLQQLKGKFLMSINDHPDIRTIFADFRLEAVEARYTIAGNANGQRAGELLITKA